MTVPFAFAKFKFVPMQSDLNIQNLNAVYKRLLPQEVK
jgi:hypothetical protein